MLIVLYYVFRVGRAAGRGGRSRARSRAGTAARAERRTGSVLPLGFWVLQAELGEEELGGCGEGDVAVPADPGAAFEVVQAEGLLQFAVVVLDAPAALGEADELGQWGVGGQVGQPVVAGLVGAGRPFNLTCSARTSATLRGSVITRAPVRRDGSRSQPPPQRGPQRASARHPPTGARLPSRLHPHVSLGWGAAPVVLQPDFVIT